MKLMSVIRILVTLLVSTLALQARAGAVIGATEPTQILNNIQLLMTYSENAQQTVTAMNQYQTMLTNLKQMTPSSLLDQAAQQLFQDQDMQKAFRDLRQVYVNGQQAAYSLAQMNQQFKGNHPGYGASVNFASAYRNWSDTNLSAAKNAIKLVTTHQEAFGSEESMINELAYKSRTAEGQMQAVQAGSAISLQLVGQLQKLRQLQMAQVQSQNEFAAAQQSEKDVQQYGLEQAFGGVTSKSVKGR